MSATNREGFLESIPRFTLNEITETPMLLEIFTNSEDESNALNLIEHTLVSTSKAASDKAKNFIKSIIGQSNINALKNIIKR